MDKRDKQVKWITDIDRNKLADEINKVLEDQRWSLVSASPHTNHLGTTMWTAWLQFDPR